MAIFSDLDILLKMDAPRKKVGCMWINYKTDGKTHANMIINEIRFVAFQNDFKDKETDPDWLIYEDKKLIKNG